jgi:2-polyprenyl-3-methyl-5-hydroxy-6-metoxy-1,4-benzoquinol methylase
MDKPEQPHENTSKNTHAVVASLLVERVKPGAAILDLPCGEGAFTLRMMERGYAVCAGDLVPRISVRNATFKACDMNQPLPFAEAAFDAVVCIDGIEHIERPFDFIRECARVTRDEGCLVISTPNISELRSRWRWFLTGFHNKAKAPLNEAIPSAWHHIRLLSLADLRYMLHSNGFRIDAVRCNRMKAAGWLFALLIPVSWVATVIAFRRKKDDAAQRARKREILKQMFLPAVLFGETLIVRARRVRAP